MYLLHNDLNLEIKTLYFEVIAGWVDEFRLKGKSQESLAGPYIPSRNENLSGMDLKIIKTFLACFFFVHFFMFVVRF